jgi:hypothetical protein
LGFRAWFHARHQQAGNSKQALRHPLGLEQWLGIR